VKNCQDRTQRHWHNLDNSLPETLIGTIPKIAKSKIVLSEAETRCNCMCDPVRNKSWEK
jgi:hypothetical protein